MYFSTQMIQNLRSKYNAKDQSSPTYEDRQKKMLESFQRQLQSNEKKSASPCSK